MAREEALPEPVWRRSCRDFSAKNSPEGTTRTPAVYRMQGRNIGRIRTRGIATAIGNNPRLTLGPSAHLGQVVHERQCLRVKLCPSCIRTLRYVLKFAEIGWTLTGAGYSKVRRSTSSNKSVRPRPRTIYIGRGPKKWHIEVECFE